MPHIARCFNAIIVLFIANNWPILLTLIQAGRQGDTIYTFFTLEV